MGSRMLMMLSAALLGAAAAPTHSAQSNQNRSAEKIERALERIAVAQEKPAETPKGNEYERPCKDGEYDNRSDLCAQWYAARAARDAADSAYWAVFWTVASLILSAAGFIALLFTIKQGREANRIAHASYESEIRPIFVLDTPDSSVVNNGEAVVLKLQWKNIGKLPGRILSCRVWREPKHPTLKIQDANLAIIKSNAVFVCPRILFWIEDVRHGDCYVAAEIEYEIAVGQSKSKWKSRYRGKIAPSIHWPNPEGGVFSGVKMPAPDAIKFIGCKIDEDARGIEMT